MAYDTFIEMKLLIKFITSDFGKVISSRIEEHCHNQALCALYCKRLARTDLLIQLKETFLIVCGGILCKAGKDLWLFTKQIDDLSIGSNAQCTDQNSDRNLSCSVYTYIKYII